MMQLDHHAYKTSVMNKNGRDRLGFECQFLFQYLACNGDQFLANLEVGTPHGCKLHNLEQLCPMLVEGVIHIGLKYQYFPGNSDQQRFLDKKIAEQTRSIVG